MNKSEDDERRHLVDMIARSASPEMDRSAPSQRSVWWWVFYMPGKVLLWLQYMFPDHIVGVFGSARRRNVPLMQLLYSIGFWVVVLFVAFFILASTFN